MYHTVVFVCVRVQGWVVLVLVFEAALCVQAFVRGAQARLVVGGKLQTMWLNDEDVLLGPVTPCPLGPD